MSIFSGLIGIQLTSLLINHVFMVHYIAHGTAIVFYFLLLLLLSLVLYTLRLVNKQEIKKRVEDEIM